MSLVSAIPHVDYASYDEFLAMKPAVIQAYTTLFDETLNNDILLVELRAIDVVSCAVGTARHLESAWIVLCKGQKSEWSGAMTLHIHTIWDAAWRGMAHLEGRVLPTRLALYNAVQRTFPELLMDSIGHRFNAPGCKLWNDFVKANFVELPDGNRIPIAEWWRRRLSLAMWVQGGGPLPVEIVKLIAVFADKK